MTDVDDPLSREEMLLLEVLRGWAIEHGVESVLDTRMASDLVLANLRQSGEPFSMLRSRPWFGLERSVRRLTNEGLVELDFGMAQFVPPGSPTPEPERFFLRISDKGRDRIAAFRASIKP